MDNRPQQPSRATLRPLSSTTVVTGASTIQSTRVPPQSAEFLLQAPKYVEATSTSNGHVASDLAALEAAQKTFFHSDSAPSTESVSSALSSAVVDISLQTTEMYAEFRRKFKSLPYSPDLHQKYLQSRSELLEKKQLGADNFEDTDSETSPTSDSTKEELCPQWNQKLSSRSNLEVEHLLCKLTTEIKKILCNFLCDDFVNEYNSTKAYLSEAQVSAISTKEVSNPAKIDYLQTAETDPGTRFLTSVTSILCEYVDRAEFEPASSISTSTIAPTPAPPAPAPVLEMSPSKKRPKSRKRKQDEDSEPVSIFESSTSPLVEVDLADIINTQTFTTHFTESERTELLKHLPQPDRTPSQTSHIFSVPELQLSILEFQSRLSAGMYDPEYAAYYRILREREEKKTANSLKKMKATYEKHLEKYRGTLPKNS